jgi:hypothetical protein
MSLSRPGREHEQQPSVRASAHLVAFSRFELHEQAAAAVHRAPVPDDYLDLTCEDQQPRSLMNLVLLKRLSSGKAQNDHAGVVVRRDDLRRVRVDRQP